jgi:predicted RecA/RadA family phage recombinase
MTNFEKEGDVQTFAVPASGVVSGQPYQIGQALCIAAKTIAYVSGLNFEGLIRGVFTVTKAASQAWSQGDLVYWDDTNRYFTTDSTGNRLAGWATEAAASGAALTTGHVYLDGVARDNEAT